MAREPERDESLRSAGPRSGLRSVELASGLRSVEPASGPRSERAWAPPPSSTRGMPASIERVVTVEGSVFAACGATFFQVRRGVLTVEAYERIRAALMRHRMLTPRGVLQGLISLIEPDAPIPAEPVRVLQKAFVTELLKQPSMRMAVVVLGEGVTASLLRSSNRGVMNGHRQLRFFERSDAACAWIGSELAVSYERLFAALEDARAIAARELGVR